MHGYHIYYDINTLKMLVFFRVFICKKIFLNHFELYRSNHYSLTFYLFGMRFFLLCVLLIFTGHLFGQTIKLSTGNQDKKQLLLMEINGLIVMIDSKGSVQDKDLSFPKNTSGNSVDYDIRDRVSRIGDMTVDYDIHDRISRVGDKRIDYNISDRVSRIGDDRVEYDIHDRVSRIGDKRIDYNIHGRVSRIGDDRVDYDIHDRVSRVGDKRIDYDIRGRVTTGGLGNYFLLLELIEKYNSK